jgi:hypothetical protein
MKSALAAGCWLAASSLLSGYQATGVIEGQVLNLSTGAPLKKTIVRLVGVGARQGAMPTMANKETDDQGHFVFSGLEAGRYQLSAERQGFLRQNYGARKNSGGSTPLALGQDQHLKDIVFKLSPQSVITGKVLDEDGEPVANLQVRAMKRLYQGGKKQWSAVGNGTTSDIGEYRVPNLAPGRYLVSTTAQNPAVSLMQTPSNEPLPATPEMIYASTFYPSTTAAATAVPVDVGAGAEVRGIDIRLVKTRVFRVRGRVVVPSGVRAAQVMVMLTPQEGGTVIQSAGAARAPENRFEIRGVAPGSYIASARFANGGQQYVASQPVEIGGDHVDGLVLTMASGGDLQGSLKVEGAAAPVDLKNVTVSLRAVGFSALAPPRARVGADLKFTLKDVPPLRFTVNVGGAPDNCYVKSIQYGGRDVPDTGVEMTGSAALEITLSATAGQVDAVVVDKDGKPAAGAMVALIPKDEKAPTMGRSANESGIVTFKALRPGDYKLLAWEDIEANAYLDPDFVKPFDSQVKTVKLDASGHEAVHLRAIPAEETGG